MPVIRIEIKVIAPIEVVFDLSRSIDLHKISTAHTNEEAVAGKTSGLIELGESVTWKARHLGKTRLLTSKITVFEPPYYFVDEMTEGAFKGFRHEHIFKEEGGVTIMTDVFTYISPYGILGRLVDLLFLKHYMQRLLTKRNLIVKQFAENPEKHKQLLSKNPTV